MTEPLSTSVDNLGFEALKNSVLEHTGLAYYNNKNSELQLKFSKRMKELLLSTYQDYLNFLNSSQGKAEFEILIQELTIGETYFFRYREQFDALRETLLPALISGGCAERKRLSIWSAGCATGEEVYSLAILLHNAFPQLQNWQVEIVGTDINADFLQRAKRGHYRKWSFRSSSEQFQQQHFSLQNQEWQVLPIYRKWVRFQAHNLIQDQIASLAPPGGFDLIICRNVLIYFDPNTHRRLIDEFYVHLQPGGWLILGPAELTPLSCQPFIAHDLSRLSCFQKPASKDDSLGSFSARPLLNWQPQLLSQEPSLLPLPPALFSCPEFLPLDLPEQISSSVSEHSETALKSQPLLDPVLEIRQLADQGQLDVAESLCRRLLVREPLHTRFYYYLALILSAQNKPSEALQAFKQVLYLDRKHVLAHYHQGLLLQQTEQFSVAQKSFRNALELLRTQSDEELLPDADDWTVAQLKAQIRLQQERMI
jgi:chemotaxis protein methyltransferase CheR